MSAEGPDDGRVVPLFDDDLPLLPEQTRDDTDAGWGERPDRRDDDDRLRADRPPHWG